MNLDQFVTSKEVITAVGTIVGAAAGGLALLMLCLKLWGLFRKEFSNADIEKQQAALQNHTTTRMMDLEKQLTERQEKINALTSELGELRGECKALKMNLETVQKSKDYWSTRAREMEDRFKQLEDAVDSLTVHAIQAELKLSVLNGDLDAKYVNLNPAEALPRVIRDKLDKARATVTTDGGLAG